MSKIKYKKDLLKAVLDENNDDTIGKIWASYVDEKSDKDLTPVQRNQKERIESAYVLLKNYRSIDQVAKAIHSRYHGISLGQAYIDCEAAVRIFGNFKQNIADGMNFIMYELAMRIMQLAIDRDDLVSANKAWQNAAQSLGMYDKSSGIIAPEDMESHTYVLEIRTNGRPMTLDLDKLYEAKPQNVKKAIQAVETREELTVDVMAEILDEKEN